MGRRDYGTGSVYQRKQDGRWLSVLDAGWNAKGGRRRLTRVSDTEEQARAKMRKMLREVSAAQAPQASSRTTVRTWAEKWLEITSDRLRPSTWSAHRSQITTWIIPTIGHRQLAKLTPTDRRNVARAMAHSGLRQSTINRADSTLGTLLHDAVIEGYEVPAPVLAINLQADTETDRADIPLPDALEILRVASARPDASRWVAALLQGMRPAECLGLTWGAVDLEGGALDVSWQLKPLPYRVARDHASGFRVPAGYMARQLDGALHLVRPKTSKGQRIIPLVPWMAEALQAWRTICPISPHDLVWPRIDGRPKTDRADREAWRDIVDAAQVAHVEGTEGRRYALYEARHTTATLLREAGVDDETIKAIMGHATILSTRAYLHTDTDRMRQALEGIAARLALG